ncbi:MAG: hypothetical protein BZY75_05540 [SAR202 cluster bacterium Io17-Chloro-G7]|nr:MAG: hypothetical protein BZY75_05540 [SAR202 cluster bacterium Io17-Chloro-G7]
MKVKLADQSVIIQAPRPLVFQMFTSFDREIPSEGTDRQSERSRPSETGEGAKVVEREGNRLLVEFTSRYGRKLYRTLEKVRLYPDDRITFQHLKGPLHHATEEFRLEVVPKGTRITYQGRIECRMPFLPGIGWLVALLYVRPKYGSLVQRHMGLLKKAAESLAP